NQTTARRIWIRDARDEGSHCETGGASRMRIMLAPSTCFITLLRSETEVAIPSASGTAVWAVNSGALRTTGHFQMFRTTNDAVVATTKKVATSASWRSRSECPAAARYAP